MLLWRKKRKQIFQKIFQQFFLALQSYSIPVANRWFHQLSMMAREKLFKRELMLKQLTMQLESLKNVSKSEQFT